MVIIRWSFDISYSESTVTIIEAFQIDYAREFTAERFISAYYMPIECALPRGHNGAIRILDIA